MLASNSQRLAKGVRLVPLSYGSVIASDCLRDYYSSSSRAEPRRPTAATGGRPNVLVYSRDSRELFAEARGVLEGVLHPHGCLVYHLTSEEAGGGSHWTCGARALVVVRAPDSEAVGRKLADFARDRSCSGRLLLYWSEDPAPACLEELRLVGVDQDGGTWRNVLSYRRRLDSSDRSVLRRVFAHFRIPVRATTATGEEEEATADLPPRLSPGHLVCEDSGLRRRLLARGRVDVHPVHLSGKEEVITRINFVANRSQEEGEEESESLSVLTEEKPASFDEHLYLEHLRTKDFGRVLIHVPVIGTGFDLLDREGRPLQESDRRSFAVVPDRQLSGRGRGGNAWISPVGCAMFCLQFYVKQSSLLGQRAPILCHLVALSIVLAMRGLLARRRGADLDVRIKWPNDIYLGREVKIGGVLLHNHCRPDDTTLLSVGAGVNLDNELPTASLNGALAEASGGAARRVEREVLLAEVFNQLELVLDRYQSGGQDLVMEQYYRHWLHDRQEVAVRTRGPGSEVKAVVQGVDEYGYLVVRDETGVARSVHPDGNSFDMMSNLILPKSRNQ